MVFPFLLGCRWLACHKSIPRFATTPATGILWQKSVPRIYSVAMTYSDPGQWTFGGNLQKVYFHSYLTLEARLKNDPLVCFAKNLDLTGIHTTTDSRSLNCLKMLLAHFVSFSRQPHDWDFDWPLRPMNFTGTLFFPSRVYHLLYGTPPGHSPGSLCCHKPWCAGDSSTKNPFWNRCALFDHSNQTTILWKLL